MDKLLNKIVKCFNNEASIVCKQKNCIRKTCESNGLAFLLKQVQHNLGSYV